MRSSLKRTFQLGLRVCPRLSFKEGNANKRLGRTCFRSSYPPLRGDQTAMNELRGRKPRWGTEAKRSNTTFASMHSSQGDPEHLKTEFRKPNPHLPPRRILLTGSMSIWIQLCSFTKAYENNSTVHSVANRREVNCLI